MIEEVHNYEDEKTSRVLKWISVLAVLAFAIFVGWCATSAGGQEPPQTNPRVQIPVKIVQGTPPPSLTKDQTISLLMKSRQLGRLDVAIPMQENVVKSAQELLKELIDQRDTLAAELGLDGKD